MNNRTKLATLVGRTSQKMLKKFTSGGSSLPGKLATKLDPNILSELGKDYEVVVITGTNGKSMTTALTVNILSQKYGHVITNDTGSNMLQGIVSTFIQDTSSQEDGKKIAVLEIDEASLRHVTEHIKPSLILITNLFTDQTDRYSNIESTYDVILEGIAKTPQTVLMLNGDEPIFNSRPLSNPHRYFGFDNDDKTTDIKASHTDNLDCPVCGHELHYHLNTYGNLGDYFCTACDFKRPELGISLDKVTSLTPEAAQFTIDNYDFEVPMAGLYNVYNALAAYAIGQFFGVEPADIATGLHGAKRIFGRQEAVFVEDKDVRINLMKNPVGLDQIIDLMALEDESFSLISIINNNAADGTDVSWINDSKFEAFSDMPIQATAVAGMRQGDMAERLIKAGIDANSITSLDGNKEIIDAIKQAPTRKVYILTTYTAMLDLRKELADQGYVNERMKA